MMTLTEYQFSWYYSLTNNSSSKWYEDLQQTKTSSASMTRNCLFFLKKCLQTPEVKVFK